MIKYSTTEPKVSQGDIIVIDGDLQLFVQEIIDGYPYACTYGNNLLPDGPFAMGATAKVEVSYKKIKLSDNWKYPDGRLFNGEDVSTIMEDYNEASWISPGFNDTTFLIVLDKELKDYTHFQIGDKLAYIRFSMEYKKVGEEHHYRYACKLSHIHKSTDFIDPSLIKKGTAIKLDTADKEFGKSDIIPAPFKLIDKEALENFKKEYSKRVDEYFKNTPMHQIAKDISMLTEVTESKYKTADKVNWDIPTTKERPIEDGDLRTVTVDVKAIFKKAKITTDWDEEGNALETKDGFIMSIVDSQIIYNGEPTVFLAQTLKED